MIQSNAPHYPSQRAQNHTRHGYTPELTYLIDMVIFSLLYRFGEIEKIHLTVDEYVLNLKNALHQLGCVQPLKVEYRLYQLEENGFLTIGTNMIELTPAGRQAGLIYYNRFLEISR